MNQAALHSVEIVDQARWALRAADVLAGAISSAVELRGKCVLALSGGSTPGPAFAELASRDLPWSNLVITQVDERVAPEGSPQRNLVLQQEAFAGLAASWLPLPVADPSPSGIAGFVNRLEGVAGAPPEIDIVHLGLGGDGHTASLVPGDDVLTETELLVALTGEYQGTRRLTFTRPLIERARRVVWLIGGEDKADALEGLVRGNPELPSALLSPRRSLIIADTAAAARLG